MRLASNGRTEDKLNITKKNDMAKVSIEIEDQPNGELRVQFVGDGLRTAATMESNTGAQNAAIYLAQMRAVGMDAPDLSGQ